MNLTYIIGNLLLFLILAPLFDGIVRRITARIQSRQGPPLTQGYYDLLKLLGKESLLSSPYRTFKMAPLIGFATILAVIAFLPVAGQETVLSGKADIITIIYLLTFGGLAILLGASSSRNPYAMMGASREMATMVMIEPVLAMTLIMAAMKQGSLLLPVSAMTVSAPFTFSILAMAALYLMALQAFVGRQPFDVAEAEIELLEGPFIEYSGPSYALFKYYMMLKQLFYSYLFVFLFIPVPSTGIYPLDAIIPALSAVVIIAFIALIGATNPRVRIDQAVKYYAVLAVLALGTVGLSAAGF